MSASIAERVAKGAALLDEKDPGWWCLGRRGTIDLDWLDMNSTCFCVLGQRHPTARAQSPYQRGLQVLGLSRWFDGDEHTTEEYGFDGRLKEMDTLTAEWKRVITERRAAA